MNYQAMKRHGVIVNAYYYGKEVNVKRLYTVGFQIYNILEKGNQRRQQKDQWLPGVKGGEKDE